MSDPKNPAVGELHIDGSDVEPFAEDLPPGAMIGLLATQEGFKEAAAELVTVHPAFGKAAGITDGDIEELSLINERIARIDELLPAYRKADEILTETRAKLDDKRHRILLNGAKAVDRRAGQNEELLAKYEKTRAYRSAIAKKGVLTKKAKQAKATNGANPATPPTE